MRHLPKLLLLLLLVALWLSASRSQGTIVAGTACGAGGLTAIATNGQAVLCQGNPLTWTATGGSSSGGSGGVNAQTISYTAVSGDNGKLITMNGSNLTLTLPNPPPSATWTVQVQDLNSTTLTIARNGLTINGTAANLTVSQGGGVSIYTDGSNYFTAASGAAGTNGQLQFNNNGVSSGMTGSSVSSNNLTLTGQIQAGPGNANGFAMIQGATFSDGQVPVFTSASGSKFVSSGLTSAATGGLIDSGTAAATLSGTGACATFSGQVGGKLSGSAACASATAASTLTIGGLLTAAHGYACSVQDETTRANLFQQTSHTTTSCTLTITSVTQNDVFVFTAIGF